MAWTYSGNPASSDRDEVRFLIGDTDSKDQLLSDDELDYILSVIPDPGASYHNLKAASSACEAIAAKLSKVTDKSVGSLSISYSQRRQHYVDLAKDLAARATSSAASGSPGVPVLGGGGQTYLGGDWT